MSVETLKSTYATLLQVFEAELATTIATIDPIDRYTTKAKAISNARGALAALAHALTIGFTCADNTTPKILAEVASLLGEALVEIRR